MSQISYQNDVLQLKATCSSPIKKNDAAELLMNNIISASLFNLMPEIAVPQHDAAIREMTFFRKWAIKDQKFVNLIDDLLLTQPVPVLAGKPAIFCRFHLGSYRLVMPWLMRNLRNVTLLVDAAVADLQMQDFHNVMADTCVRYGLRDGDARIIDTSRGNFGLTMLRELKKGRSLLIFVDGNSGAQGEMISDEKLIPVNFFSKKLKVRKGVAYLAHAAKVPITITAR